MHMADALVSPAVGVTMYAASATAIGYSLYRLRKEDREDILPVMGVMSAFVFAGQMVNFTIPGTGSSGHLCGGLMLSALLGPYAGFVSMAVILLIQCLLFADGGLMALGANIWNMGFYGCFVGYYLIFRYIMKCKIKNTGVKITLASVLGSVISLQLGAFSVCIETLCSGITDLPFSTFVGLMQPIHLAIGAVEGFITAAVIAFIYGVRPEMIDDNNKKSRVSLRGTVIILAIVTAFIGGGASLLASSNPDGLEWSIAGIVEEEESEEEEEPIRTAILPDYAFKNDADNSMGTTVSGLLGSAIVAGCVVIIYAGRKIFYKGTNRPEKV